MSTKGRPKKRAENFNALRLLRIRGGFTQHELGHRIGISNVSPFEVGRRQLTFGAAVAYSKFFKVPLDLLVRDDIPGVASVYTPEVEPHRSLEKHMRMAKESAFSGARGEDYVVKMEQEKLSGTRYADAVSGVYADDDKCGFDVLSFRKNGEPVFIEVKTTLSPDRNSPFEITPLEIDFAKKCIDSGKNYEIHRVYDLNSCSPGIEIISPKELLNNFNLTPINYIARRRRK